MPLHCPAMSAGPAAKSPLDQALTLLRDGRVADAEDRMKLAVHDAAERHGEQSAQWAAAQSDMGNMLLRAERPAWAAECFRAAVSVPGPLFPALKDLPDPLVEQVATIVAARIQRGIDPDAAYRMVDHLAGALDQRLGPDHPATIGAFDNLAAQAAYRGEHADRIAALEH